MDQHSPPADEAIICEIEAQQAMRGGADAGNHYFAALHHFGLQGKIFLYIAPGIYIFRNARIAYKAYFYQVLARGNAGK